MSKQLKSGNQYTLQDLFSGERKIIIPDLQRDYCWGDKKHGKENIELVTGFVSGIIDLFVEYQNSTDKKDTEHQLGMIYAYENPLNFIQLIDGQQRITTLYLLLGMLYKYSKSKNEDLRRILISDFELKEDDKEPHLQYAIRESTLYFLSDLVCEFFLENDKNDFSIDKIKKEKWYFSEYNLDPTIQSMLSALSIIDKLLKKNIKIDEFAEFIMQKIKFFYFDMQNREHGEDMFVVINTTGEPLTATENLKPKLIGNIEVEEDRKKASDIWEKWEVYFWQNKKNDEHVDDDGLNEFLNFYWQIKTKQVTYSLKDILQKIEPKEEIDSINEYFEQYKELAEYFNDKKFKSVLKYINPKATNPRKFTEEQKQLIILPMLNFMKKFPNEKEHHRLFLRRLRKNYFDKQWKERNKNFIDWRHIIQIIEKSTSEQDVLTFDTSSEERKKEFKTISNVPLNSWYNEEEQYKTELRKIDIENKIEKWEDHKDFMGDISFLRSVHSKVEGIKENKDPTITDLEKYYKNYIETIDLVRNQYGEKEKDTRIEKKKLSNLFRLFYLFIGCNKVGHIYRTSWEYFEGVAFSSINRSHLWNDGFQKMCVQTNVKNYIEDFVKEHVKDNHLVSFDKANYTPDRAIKCWLTLKVFNANEKGIALAYYDGKGKGGTGVAACYEMDDNRLIKDEAFSLANFICGFAVKSGGGGGNYIETTSKDLWLKPNIIDTPFAGIKFEEDKRTYEQIRKNNKAIKKIIENLKLDLKN